MNDKPETSFPIGDWFNAGEKISECDMDVAEAQIRLYAHKAGLPPESQEVNASVASMRQAAADQNSSLSGTPDMLVRVDGDFLKSISTGGRGAGWNAKQLALLGISWPPTHGWRKRLKKKLITSELARELKAISGVEKKRSDKLPSVSKPVAKKRVIETPARVSPKAEPALQIWTDGSAWPNPGPGGWGWHSSDGKERYGGARHTTNNRMEMTAILEALIELPDGAEAVVYSDSQYCVKGLTDWRDGWRKKGWRRKGEDIPNRDLWIALEAQLERVQPTMRWVRGHNGDHGNERADALAEAGRMSASPDAKPEPSHTEKRSTFRRAPRP